MDSQLRESSTEDSEYKLEDSFGHSRYHGSVQTSKAVLRSDGLKKLDGSEILSCITEVVGSSQSVASNGFRWLKGSDFLATVLVEEGRGIGYGGKSISGVSGKRISQGVIARATGNGEKGGF